MHIFFKSLVLDGQTRSERRVNGGVAWLIAAVLIVTTAAAQNRSEIGPSEAVASALVLANRQQRAGDYPAARTALLEGLSKAPESAALLNALGSVEQEASEFIEAERRYLQALKASATTPGDLEWLCVMNNLGTLYLETNQSSKGERVREELERLPASALQNHPVAAGLLLNVIASLEHARNNDSEAIRYYAQSLLLLRKTQGAVSADATAVESNLGFLNMESGRYEAAKDLFRQAIRELETALGPEDSSLIRPLLNLAACENRSGHSIEAEALARRAVELSGKIFGSEHPLTATAMLQQASALRKLGRRVEAHSLEKHAKSLPRNASAASFANYTVGVSELARHTKP